MEPANRAGRIIGALILAQMFGSALANFVLTAPLFGEPGFLVNAAPHSQQIGLSVLLGLALAALAVAIAILAFPIFSRHSQALALWFFALAVVSFSIAAVEQMNVMSMVSLSEAYAKANAADRAPFQALRGVVASARNWPHFLGRIFDGITIFVLYLALFRSALAPRALAAFGMVAVLLQVTSIALPFFGQGVVFPMLAPLGVSQLILAIWLLVKGLRSPVNPGDATA